MMNYFGISCVFAILLVAARLDIISTSGETGNKEQEQADGITKTDTYLSSIIAFKGKLDNEHEL